MTRGRGTALGFGAIALWSVLALLTVLAGPAPPFQLTAICFAIGGALGLVWIAASGAGFSRMRGLPPAVWIVGIGGLFGYHACYFTALQLAPPAQASLVAYLWPLLIVLFSGLLPGEKLRARHVIGAAIAFCGAWLVVLGPGAAFSAEHLPGYGAAAACAVIWAGYSVLSRRLGQAPTECVAVFCIATAALSLLAHLAFETTVWPTNAGAWAATIALGAGPVGLAFYLWDFGCKRGDIQLLGVGAYGAPLASTLLLVIAGFTRPTSGLALAAILIAGGALLAARAAPRRAGATAATGRKDVRSLP